MDDEEDLSTDEDEDVSFPPAVSAPLLRGGGCDLFLKFHHLFFFFEL